jgi:hypothetical protein
VPKIAYEHKQFSRASLARIEQANDIIAEYQVAGFQLTLRQLYYQFVSRDLIPNTQQSYKSLGGTINDARMAGLIDWLAIEDRTRFLRALSSWGEPADIMRSAAASYHEDWWAGQPHYVEVWIEKDALAGVFEGVCNELDVPLFSCRGYASASEVWAAGRRLYRKIAGGQKVVVFHFGDHDPSGLDMTRDITDRLTTFIGHHVGHIRLLTDFRVERVALTMGQINQYGPPPNPAKVTDSRFAQYQAEYGDESWELDALDPAVLAALVTTNVESVMDADLMEAAKEHEALAKIDLKKAAKFWESELLPVLADLELGDEESE